MPLPFALLLSFSLGVALAQLGKAELLRDDAPIFLSRPFAVVAALAAFVLAPVLGYFAAFHGDWAYLYVVPWQSIPSALDLVLVLVAAAQAPIGFVVAAPVVRARKMRAVALLAGVPAALALLLLLVTARRLGVSASYVQYHGGFGALPITKSALGRSVLLAAVTLLGGAGWAVRALRAG